MSNKFVIADSQACIGCKTCMAACISKHDVAGDVPTARLNLVTTLSVSAPIVCRHCEDAACVAACPTKALYRDGDRVGVREDRCIGCRGCVMACPFGAVQVVSVEAPQKLGNLTIDGQTKPFVIKCDRCYDRPGGPACVEACPTGGLMLVDEQALTRSVKDRARAAATSMQEDLSSLRRAVK